MRKTYEGVVQLTPGVDFYAVSNFNMPQPPTRARGDIMKGASGASNIEVTADFTSFSCQGGTFHFTGVIPSDTIYKLYFTFKI
jgi:hypothetical protein